MKIEINYYMHILQTTEINSAALLKLNVFNFLLFFLIILVLNRYASSIFSGNLN
ncbi:hypothetical protein BN168_570045 [Clostridioides difficile CD002]|nr:hypothetical protein BN168_570045 [Clostridioides difficile CD002]